MKNRKRLLTLALLCLALAFSVLGLFACGTAETRDPQIVAVYNAYVANANENGTTPLSYEEWLKSIKGEKGDKGDPGKSAYEIWLDNGFTGTEQDFLNWLKNQSNNADSHRLSFALTDEDTYSVSVGLATERSEIVIPATYNNKPVTKIANKAFNECTNLKKVTIPDSVTSIGNSAFNSCSSLTSVTIGNGVTSIGYSAFDNCTSLISVTIGKGVTSIGNFAFNSCSSLTSVTIGNGVTSIGNSAFSGCPSLTSITIPDSVTSIGDWAFAGCTSLTSIIIGKGVTSIGNFAFSSCLSLNAVYITDIAAWCGISFHSSPGSNPLCDAHNLYLNGELVAALVIPDSVKSIGDFAFEGCTSLTSVTIPDSVTSINSAFKGCTSLTSITIPDGVTIISDYAFYNCSSLTSITIPDGVTNIGSYAYSGCYSLANVSIGKKVASIGEFSFYGCSSLVKVTLPKSLKAIGKGVFSKCSPKLEVYYNGTIAEWNEFGKDTYLIDSDDYLYYINCNDGVAYKKYWTDPY